MKRNHEDENRALIIKYRETGDESYRDEFFEKNLKLASYAACKFRNKRYTHDDLVGFAYMGLIKAHNTYDVSKRARITTYSVHCMVSEIITFFRKEQRHMANAFLDDSKYAYRDMETEYTRERDHIARMVDRILAEYIIGEMAKTLRDDTERTVFLNLIADEPKTQAEIASKLGSRSQQSVSYIVRQLQKRARKIALEGICS